MLTGPVRRSATELCGALALGLFLACLWTWPLLPNLGSSLPFDPASAGPNGSDMHIWAWNFWWAGEVAAGRGAPFHSDAIFLPLGHSLVFHTHSFFWGILTLPLQWLFGVTFAVGAALLLLPAAAFAAASAAAFAAAAAASAAAASATSLASSLAFCSASARISMYFGRSQPLRR